MALIVSAASGNFNAGATWVGGVVPGVGDTAQASNGHAININVNTTCDQIQNSNSGTGTFALNAGVTLTANALNQGSTGVSVITYSPAAPSAANIVGNITAGSSNNRVGVRHSGSGTLNITGNVTGNITGAWGVENISTSGITNITGNCTGVRNSSSGSLYITGNVIASSSFAGADNQSSGILSVIGTLQPSQGFSAVVGANIQQVTVLSGPFLTEITRGVAPVYCAAWRWNASPSNSTYMEVMTNNLLAKRNLVTDDNVTGMPAVTNVRSGTVYGPTSSLAGTLVVPAASSVAFGVPVDATTGTATLTAANVRTALGLASANLDTQLAVLSNLDAAVSSRLAPNGTLATVTTLTNAPASVTPAQIRLEMDSNSTKLANLDATVSSRLATSGYTAPTTPPTAAANATAVRTELATELARVDVATSTRLAGSSYTAPSNSDVTAIKAKTDLLETTRLAQCSTVATTGAQIAAALS